MENNNPPPYLTPQEFTPDGWSSFMSSFDAYTARGGRTTLPALVAPTIVEFMAQVEGVAIAAIGLENRLRLAISKVFAPKSKEESRSRLRVVKMSSPVCPATYSKYVLDNLAVEKTIPEALMPSMKTRVEIFLAGIPSKTLREELDSLDREEIAELRRDGMRVVADLTESLSRFSRSREEKSVRPPPTPQEPGAVRCFKCDRKGHYASDCRSKKPFASSAPFGDMPPVTPLHPRRDGTPGRRDATHTVPRPAATGNGPRDDPTPRRLDLDSPSRGKAWKKPPSLNTFLGPTVDWQASLPKKNIRVSPTTAGDAIELQALLDSGATHSFVNKATAKRLSKLGAPSRNASVVIALGGTPNETRCNQIMDVTVQVGTRKEVIPFLVIDSTFRIILGYSALRKLKMISVECDEEDTPSPESPPDDIPSGIGKLLKEYPDLFDGDLSLGAANVEPFSIEMEDPSAPPLRPQFRRQPINLADSISDQVRAWLAHGIVQPSTSVFNSPIVMARKKNGTFRLCVDFRKLNERTRLMAFPMQHVGSLLERLRGSRYFIKLDLTSGFLQVPLTEDSSKFTAFSTSDGHYEFLRMPFGLKNSPLHFQHVMNDVLRPLLHKGVEIYMDDNIVHAPSLEELTATLEKVFQLLRAHNLKLNREKCFFGASSEIEFLGHVVSGEGVRISPSRIEAIQRLSKPTTTKELRRFLGTLNYVRDFLPNYSPTAKPLYDLLGGPLARNKPLADWSHVHDEAFDATKALVNEATLLHFAHPDLPLFLETDASDNGIGAVLYQTDEHGTKTVISYISKAFSGASTRWTTAEKEAFAAYFAITKLRHQLLGRTFTILSDHRNLIFMHSTTVPKILRWQLKLQEFDYRVEFIPGKDNVVADGLSRLNAMPDVSAPQPNQIEKFHGALTGHHGIKRTLDFMRNVGLNWPGMRNDVQKFIQDCPVCCKGDPATTHKFAAELRTTMSDQPFERFSMDLMGPFPADEHENKYVLVLVDNFSRYTLLRAIPNKEAITVADAILDAVGTFNVIPKEIRSDQGAEFCAATTRELIKLLGATHTFTVAGHPQSNGLTERRNKEIGRHLRNLASEKDFNANWGRALFFVQRIINLTPHEVTKLSPMRIVFGIYSPSSPAILDDHATTPPTVDGPKFYQSLCDAQRSCLLTAQRNQKQYQDQYLSKSPPEPTELSPGDLVLARHRSDTAPSKLAPRLRGPYTIVERTGTNRYTAEHLKTQGRIDVHIDDLVPFRGSRQTAERAATIDCNNKEHFVDHIVAHKFEGRPSLRSIKFLVRWSGWGAQYDQWRPYRVVHDVAALDLYLQDHPELHGIVPLDVPGKGGVTPAHSRTPPNPRDRPLVPGPAPSGPGPTPSNNRDPAPPHTSVLRPRRPPRSVS